MKYYYIAYRKRRGYARQYAGDGVIEAKNKAEAREMVAYSYGVSAKNIVLKERPSS